MHYLVTITPTMQAADALDAGPGGPGPLFEFIGARYKPVMFWVTAGRRSASWIIDVTDAAGSAAAMLVSPVSRKTEMARLRRLASQDFAPWFHA
jgi:hypothetical protein